MQSYTKIITGLYIGDGNSPKVIMQTKEPISHVISLVPISRTLKKILHKKSIKHIEHFVKNDINENIIDHFNELYPILKDILNNKSETINLLIHCELGKSRSAAIAVLILMRKYRYSFDNAYEMVKLKRDVVQLNQKFIEDLKGYKKKRFK